MSPSPVFFGVHVDLPQLFRDLLHLCSSVGLDDDAVSAPLVALVADLQALCHTDGGRQHDPGHLNGHRVIAVDANLLLTVLESGLTGLEELSTINQAVGFLMDQGHPSEQAHATLRGGAASAGVEPHIFAARLMRG